MASGDQFVGRCLTLLPILSVKFGASPAYLQPNWEEWGSALAEAQVPMLFSVTHLCQLATMCTASLLFHRNFVIMLQPNHVVRMSHLVQNAFILRTVEDNSNIVVEMYLWKNKTHAFSGIPPHIVLLQRMEQVRKQQETLMNTFVKNLQTAIDESGLTGSRVTEQRLQRLFDGFSRTMRQQLEAIGTALPQDNGKTERVETGVGYQWHYFNGRINQVPKDWHFPRVGVPDVWQQWWIGDLV